MAHVRAVGQVVAAIHAGEQRIHVGRFQAGTARCVKDHFGGVESLQLGADVGECLRPADRDILVGRGVVFERMGEAAGLFEVVILPFQQLADGVHFEEFGRDAVAGQLPRGRLGAILAEFGEVRLGRFAPGATDAHEALGLVLATELPQRLDRRHLLARVDFGERLHRSPAACWAGIWRQIDFAFVAHGISPGLAAYQRCCKPIDAPANHFSRLSGGGAFPCCTSRRLARRGASRFQTGLIDDDSFDPHAHPRLRPRRAQCRDLWRARRDEADPRPGHPARRPVDDHHRCRELSRLRGRHPGSVADGADAETGRTCRHHADVGHDRRCRSEQAAVSPDGGRRRRL